VEQLIFSEDVRRLVQRACVVYVRLQSISQLPRWKGIVSLPRPSHGFADDSMLFRWWRPHSLAFLLVQDSQRTASLCDELHDTSRLLDLALGVFAEVTCANDERYLGNPALAEDLAVAEREEVENRCSVGGAFVGEVLFALLERDKGPQLFGK